ncbi:hypothetical protein AAC387_Pa09g0249 [Persea americana]
MQNLTIWGFQKEAIRKILGQDSSWKKREVKLQKRRDELAQEKAANDADLGSIFDDWKPRSYPPREKCAGPTCTNPYKYRDSKSNLPLCSLQCYRAVNLIPQRGPAEMLLFLESFLEFLLHDYQLIQVLLDRSAVITYSTTGDVSL